MLTLDSVWKSIPSQFDAYILRDCSYTFTADRIYAIQGMSGVGKTSLLRLLNHLTAVDRGRVLLEEQDISRLHPSEVRQRIGLLSQTPAFVGDTVESNMLFAQRFARRDGADFRELLAHVHLDASFLDRKVTELSVGQQQRVCLARTLVAQPDVLLLDEPTSALDDATADRILALVREISIGEKLLTIFVTHRRSHARKLGQVNLELRDLTLKEIS